MCLCTRGSSCLHVSFVLVVLQGSGQSTVLYGRDTAKRTVVTGDVRQSTRSEQRLQACQLVHEILQRRGKNGGEASKDCEG